MKPNITVVNINLDHLLWRTRSKGQDYDFIKIPKSPSIYGWFSFFGKVFSNREPDKNPKNIIGKLGPFQFVATCFIDDKYFDLSRRPIKQYLIWLLHDNYDISKIKESLANDWGKDFISPSKGLYQLFYESSDTSKLDRENYIINIERSSDNFQKLEYEDIGKIELPKKDTISSRHLDQKTKKEVEETFEEAIGKALIEGEKWAVKVDKGEFVSVKVFKRKYLDQSGKELEDFLQCLARSFGGSTKDQFLKSIAGNPKVGVGTHVRNCQKGFDSIVNVLKKHRKHEKLLDLDENKGKAFVSECINEGASPDDECIRNIYLRLKELAKQDKA